MTLAERPIIFLDISQVHKGLKGSNGGAKPYETRPATSSTVKVFGFCITCAAMGTTEVLLS
jgi:hypothetical protein